MSVSGNGASAPGGVTAAADSARAPAASASGDTASAPGTSASPGAASAPGVPDTWTWVWNWTGACLNAPAAAPRAGWTWVWNWSCADDAAPAAASPTASGPSGHDVTPIGVSATPAVPVVDQSAGPAPLAGPASPRAASSAGGTAAGSPPLAPPPATGAVDAQRFSFSLLVVPNGAGRSLAPRARSAPPAARAAPVRERGRRDGAGGGGERHRPFGPDPTAPLMVGTAASSGGTAFFVLLTMALMAAVSLLDPAGLGTRVAAATWSGLERIVRRIDRPG